MLDEMNHEFCITVLCI